MPQDVRYKCDVQFICMLALKANMDDPLVAPSYIAEQKLMWMSLFCKWNLHNKKY
jgi:hypothetical protein